MDGFDADPAPVVVATCADRIEARLTSARLAAAGVAAAVIDELEAAALHLDRRDCICVTVAADHARRAIQLLAA